MHGLTCYPNPRIGSRENPDLRVGNPLHWQGFGEIALVSGRTGNLDIFLCAKDGYASSGGTDPPPSTTASTPKCREALKRRTRRLTRSLGSTGVDSALLIDDAGGMDVGLAFVNSARLVVRDDDEERARQVLVDVVIFPTK